MDRTLADMTPEEARERLSRAGYRSISLSLTYNQRKALRRLGRGQSITRTMSRDPLVQKFYTLHIPAPDPNMNILEWMAWEEKVMGIRPKLTPFGRAVLAELEATDD